MSLEYPLMLFRAPADSGTEPRLFDNPRWTSLSLIFSSV